MNKLLEIISKNNDFTTAQLAAMLNESEKDVARQLKDLKDRGIVRGSKAVVDWDKVLDTGVTAIIEMKVTPKAETGFDEIAKIIMSYDNVDSVYLAASSRYDLITIVRGKNIQEIAEFVSKRLSTIENVMGTATNFVLMQYKGDGIAFYGDEEDEQRKFFDIANEMDNVISLSIGEPDFTTPWHVRQEGIESLRKGHTWYSPNRGFLELRKQISKYYARRFNVEYDPEDEIVVTVGGSEAIDLCIRALIQEGDEVLIPQPAFVCYEPMTIMADGTPVVINTKAENGFRLTAQELEEKITPKSKLLILPFPNNPTGAVMRREHLEEIAKVVEKHNLIVMSDEIYGELTYGKERHVSFADIPGMKERTP